MDREWLQEKNKTFDQDRATCEDVNEDEAVILDSDPDTGGPVSDIEQCASIHRSSFLLGARTHHSWKINIIVTLTV